MVCYQNYGLVLHTDTDLHIVLYPQFHKYILKYLNTSLKSTICILVLSQQKQIGRKKVICRSKSNVGLELQLNKRHFRRLQLCLCLVKEKKSNFIFFQPQRYIDKNRARYRYLENEVSFQQLFCHIHPAIQWSNLGNLLHTVWVMQNNTTRWRDLCDKKTANFWLHPPSCCLDIYSTLYFIYISLWVKHYSLLIFCPQKITRQ